MSYLESWFFDNVINKYKLFEKYDIINEFSEYPYFIDFAFTNIKLAVELDGKQHFINEKRIQHDKIKDDCLLKKGWTVYRIMYNENNDETIRKFINFLKDVVNNKQIGNKVYRYSEIKNSFRKKYKKCPDCVDILPKLKHRGFLPSTPMLRLHEALLDSCSRRCPT